MNLYDNIVLIIYVIIIVPIKNITAYRSKTLLTFFLVLTPIY